MLRDALAWRCMAELVRRERALPDDPTSRAELAREHDRLLLQELGLAESSAAAVRYRRGVERTQPDDAERAGLLDP